MEIDIMEAAPRLRQNAASHQIAKKRTRAFSLLEILIALAIAAVVLLTIHQTIRSSSKSVMLSNNLFIALNLNSKVLTDLFEESRINSTIIENFEKFPELGSKNSVVDAQSPFFSHIKDSQPPWGLMTPGSDYGITEQSGQIYESLKTFTIGIGMKRAGNPTTPGHEKHMALSSIDADWKEKSGQNRSYQLEVFVPSPSGPKPDDKYLLDDDAMAARIREEFFPALEGQSLDQAISSTGCNREMIMQIGTIGVLMRDLTETLATISSEIREKEKVRKTLFKKPDSQFIGVQTVIARKIETGSSLLYNILLEASEAAQKIKNAGSASTLDKIPFAPYRQALKAFETLSGEIDNWIGCTGKAYSYLLYDGFTIFITGQEREIAREKTLEALRLCCMMGITKKSEWKKFVEQEGIKVIGRNPFLEKLYLREKMMIDDPAMFRKCCPNITYIVDRVQNKIRKTADEIPDIIALHPDAS